MLDREEYVEQAYFFRVFRERRGNVGPDRSSNGHEEWKQLISPVGTRCIEIPVGNEVGVVSKSQVPQVHQKEGEIIEHVDCGDLIIEIDAVEQGRPAFEHADVAQMQIAVAEAD